MLKKHNISNFTVYEKIVEIKKTTKIYDNIYLKLKQKDNCQVFKVILSGSYRRELVVIL